MERKAKSAGAVRALRSTQAMPKSASQEASYLPRDEGIIAAPARVKGSQENTTKSSRAAGLNP